MSIFNRLDSKTTKAAQDLIEALDAEKLRVTVPVIHKFVPNGTSVGYVGPIHGTIETSVDLRGVLKKLVAAQDTLRREY